MYLRIVTVPSSNGTRHEYVRVVEAYREGGKVKQRTVVDLGRKDLLLALLPKLERLLRGESDPTQEVEVVEAATWGPVLVTRWLFERLGLWEILDTHLKPLKGKVSVADRVFVLLANRLIRPRSEHGLARWLESDFVCDRQGRRFLPCWERHGRVRVAFRQLDAWYRTLDRLLAAKPAIELGLYHRLRDLFSLRPDLVLYDLTSTYFEGAGPKELARHGYSRDGKPQNVQVIVGLVMVGGWPIAHHVWEGNRIDATTVQEVIADLTQRFGFRRVVFVGDRGMVSEENLEQLRREGHGYLVALKRRRNPQFDAYLQAVDESRWVDGPLGINARERGPSGPRMRAQEVPASEPGVRVFVIDSEERRAYEQAQRQRALARTQQRLESLQARVAAGKLKDPAAIGAAAERALRAHHGYRYFTWQLQKGGFSFALGGEAWEREQRLEGRFVVITSERNWQLLDAVAWYKDLTDVERGFRQLKDVLALRPIYHRSAPRVKAHIFVAALALLAQRLLERQLKAAQLDLSAEEALRALETIRLVEFQFEGEKHRQGVSKGSADARAVLKALGLTDLRPPHPKGDKTVM